MTEPTKPDPLVWDVDTAAAALGLSKAHVYRLVSENRIPFRRMGRLIKFRPAELEAWIDSRTVKAVR
jgi:excisionase family DNA binding protein